VGPKGMKISFFSDFCKITVKDSGPEFENEGIGRNNLEIIQKFTTLPLLRMYAPPNIRNLGYREAKIVTYTVGLHSGGGGVIC